MPPGSVTVSLFVSAAADVNVVVSEVGPDIGVERDLLRRRLLGRD